MALTTLWLAALLGLVEQIGAECGLPGAVLEAQRQYLVEGGGDMPFGIFEHQWDSAILACKVVKILVEEALGVHARISGEASTSTAGLYAMAGCKHPEALTTDPGCGGDNVTFIHHAAMEVWGLHKVTVMQRRLKDWPQIIPENAGSMGYDGLEGMYIFSAPMTAADADSGLALEYYKSYNAKWYTPWTYFDKISDVDPSRLLKCEDTYMMETFEVADYVKFTGDQDGVVMTDLGPVAKCWFGSFWLSPACRNATETCIIAIDGGLGWAINDFMQWVSHHNMPVAYAVAASFGDYEAIGRQHTALPYWWQPDTTFIEFAPTAVVFPPYNEAERTEGNLRSGNGKVKVTKWMYPNLRQTSSRIRDFLLRMSITLVGMETMLLNMKVNGSDHATAACAWLKSETALWKSWIPSETDCMEGQGLADDIGDFVANRSESTSCRWCTAGWRSVPYSDAKGSSFVCKQCPPGTSQSVPGQTECDACELGRYSNVRAAVECKRCAVGRFWDGIGGLECRACPAPTTTLFFSAQSSSECVCPSGMYQVAGGGMTCSACPEAMVCRSPNSSEAAVPLPGQTSEYPFPEAAEGFMTLRGAPLRPYRCQPAALCPGGGIGSCAGNRDPSVIGCGLCPPNHFLGQDGFCERCTGGIRLVVMAVVFLGCALALAALVLVINQNVLQERHSTSAVVIVAGLSFSAVQAMGAFNNLAVLWPDPFKTVFNSLSLIAFNIDGLQVECTVGVGPVVKYVARQLVVPISVPTIAGIILAKKRLLDPSLCFLSDFINTIGAFFQVLFISIVLSCTLPFVCYGHPGSNGYSMLSAPSVLCYEDNDHVALMAVGTTSFLVIVCPFAGLVCYGTFKYQTFVRESSTNQGGGLRMFRFLFFRFRTTAYFFSCPMLLRSLLLCFIPVIFRDDGAIQIIMTCSVYTSFMGLQLSLWAWRCSSANIADGAISNLMILMLVCASMTTPHEDLAGTMMIVGGILFALFIIFFLAAAGYNLYLRFVPRPYFSKFICHHKLHAAAQARFLQLMLQRKLRQDVFIDSDHLTDLGELFECVRSRVGMLVVFLTRDTLRRPWCAGEVTITFSTHQSIVLVKTPDFVAPSSQQLANLNSYIDTSSCNLLEHGVTMSSVGQAFTWILSGEVTSVSLDTTLPGRACFGALVNELSSRSRSNLAGGVIGVGSISKVVSMPEGSASGGKDMIVVSSDPSDREATSGAGILIYKMQEHLLGMSSGGIRILADCEGNGDGAELDEVRDARAVVVILTVGSLTSVEQMRVIVAAVAVDADGGNHHALEIIPVSTPRFQFPSQEYFTKTLPAHFPSAQPSLPDSIRAFFNFISVFLATNGSEKVITAQALGVLARVPQAAVAHSRQARDLHELAASLRSASGTCEDERSEYSV